MWPLTLFLFTFALSQISALPVLPLTQAGIERLEELKNAGEANDGSRTFIVKVEEPRTVQKQQEQAPTQQAREFPWPYPPQFESILPVETKQHLTQIYNDQSLSAEERSNQINSVFDTLPQPIINALPLPSEFERLPADVYRRIFYIHVAPGFKWNERQQLIRDIVESLPEEQKQLMRTPKIGGPPPGFEFVLAPTVYKQLLMIHHNPRLAKEEKAELITRVMNQVPQEQIERLPLPAGMDTLPVELRQRARSLVYDYSISQPVRAQRVREFIQSLPESIRPQLR